MRPPIHLSRSKPFPSKTMHRTQAGDERRLRYLEVLLAQIRGQFQGWKLELSRRSADYRNEHRGKSYDL